MISRKKRIEFCFSVGCVFFRKLVHCQVAIELAILKETVLLGILTNAMMPERTGVLNELFGFIYNDVLDWIIHSDALVWFIYRGALLA
jgi:hypothetical protein